MANKALYDYLDVETPDSNVILSVNPHRILPEMVARNQIIHLADDDSEERISLSSNKICFVKLNWLQLKATDSGTLLDFYCDSNKGDGMVKSFKWQHPTDNHIYVVRFDSNITREIKLADLHGILNIQFKVLGKILD